MADKLHKTRGIVLRSVKYGETSVIVSVFTELFGLQSYIVNGVRTQSKKGAVKAAMFQPSAILDMVVYHNELKQLQRISEYRWGYLYQQVLTDVRKNAIAVFMVELLGKCLKQPESVPDLFYFMEDVLTTLDTADDTIAANLPLFYALHLPVFFGFRIQDNYSDSRTVLDLKEGCFVAVAPSHHFHLEEKQAQVTAQVLRAQQPGELNDLKLHGDFRRSLLQAYERFYAYHLPEFGSLRTLPVLREILS